MTLTSRPEDLLREMRTSVVPVEDPEVVSSRRERTIGRLRGVQLRAPSRRSTLGRWRNRLLLVAAVLLPSAALAARWTAWQGTSASHADQASAKPAAPLARQPSHGKPLAEPALQADGPLPVEAPALVRAAPPAGPVAAEADQALVPAHRSAPLIRRDRARLGPTSPVGTFPDAQPTQPGSTLGEENALMQRAMSAARRGEEARAVELLSQLLVGYPGSPLAQNAEVERFRAMRRLGDVAAASRAARRYLGVHQDGMARDEARRLAVEQPARSSTAAAPR